mmetsp:Transcript_1857/g.4114  ORF Transcript_1857/g.4114 Transcript_1857/m.4114 type:complete len:216 (+) Transcript_1857:4254-4901(+)
MSHRSAIGAVTAGSGVAAAPKTWARALEVAAKVATASRTASVSGSRRSAAPTDRSTSLMILHASGRATAGPPTATLPPESTHMSTAAEPTAASAPALSAHRLRTGCHARGASTAPARIEAPREVEAATATSFGRLERCNFGTGRIDSPFSSGPLAKGCGESLDDGGVRSLAWETRLVDAARLPWQLASPCPLGVVGTEVGTDAAERKVVESTSSA